MKLRVTLLVALFFAKTFVLAQAEDSSPQPIIENAGEYSETSDLAVNPAEVAQKNGYENQPIEVRRFDKKTWESVVDGQDYKEGQPPSKKRRNQKDGSQSGDGRRSDPDY